MAAIVVGIVLTAFVVTARAADGGDAKARYMSGQSHYNLNEFSEALQDFKEAYRLHPDPAFLFNIAQCERQLGEFDEAIKFYRSYLRNKPDAGNAHEVQKKIDELKGLSEAKRKSKEGAPQSVIPPTTIAPSPPPVEPSPPPVAAPPPVEPIAPPPAASPPPVPAAVPAAEAPAASVSATPGVDLTASNTQSSNDEPIYKKWWLWAGVGAVVVGVVIVAVVASSGSASAPSSGLGNQKVF
jgi:tetratricopeptide (TPR) repeat protein